MQYTCNRCEASMDITKFDIATRSTKHRRGICKYCISIHNKKRRRTKRGVVQQIYDAQKSTSKRRRMAKPTYTKKWLRIWLMSNPEFHRLYDIWVLSEYDRDYKPSVDRKDDYVGYTEYNIQLMTWRGNREKNYKDTKDGKNLKTCKAVVQYNVCGDLVGTYNSIKLAQRATGINGGGISQACIGNRPHAGGFIWKYTEKDH